jgi:hypothetical protein
VAIASSQTLEFGFGLGWCETDEEIIDSKIAEAGLCAYVIFASHGPAPRFSIFAMMMVDRVGLRVNDQIVLH